MQIAEERPIFSLFLFFFSRQVNEVQVDKKVTEINEYSPAWTTTYYLLLALCPAWYYSLLTTNYSLLSPFSFLPSSIFPHFISSNRQFFLILQSADYTLKSSPLKGSVGGPFRTKLFYQSKKTNH